MTDTDARPDIGTLPEIADRQAAARPDAVIYRFLADGEDEAGHLTCAELTARARRLAGWMRSVVPPGERALLAYPPGLDFPVAFLACLYAGVIAVPVELPRRRSDSGRARAIAAQCGTRLHLSAGAARDRLPEVGAPWLLTDEILGDRAGSPGLLTDSLPPPAPGATAYLQYTSGSTGAPRGAAVSHRALVQQLAGYMRRGRPRLDGLTFVGWLPHTHDFGLVGFVLSAVFAGATYVAMPPSAFLRRPARWLEAISRYRGVYSGAPSFGYEMCLASPPRGAIDLACWRIASLGGDYVGAETLERFERAFAPHGFCGSAWLPAYGLAEAVLCATGRQGAGIAAFDAASLRRGNAVPAPAGEGVRLVSCGGPMPGQEVRIVEPDTRTALPDGAVGEIWLSGDSLADGYWNDEAATAARFHAAVAGEAGGARHLRTGDCGFRHGGELYVTGRLADRIVVRGENHAPDEIERTMGSVDGALRRGGAVVQTGASDGARIVAVQEAARGADHAALPALIGRAVAARHGLALDAVVLIRAGTLPRTRSGKVARRACLAAYEAGTLRALARWHRPAPEAAAHTAAAHAVAAAMLEQVRALLPGQAVGSGDDLFQLGLDSLALQRLQLFVADRFGVDLPAEAVYAAPTVARLAGAVAERRGAAALPGQGGDAPWNAVLAELRRLNAVLDAQARQLDAQTRLLTLLAAGAAPARPDPAPSDDPAPLTETQREILMLPALHAGAEGAFTIMMVLAFAGAPDAAAVRRALRAVTARHAALRAGLDAQGRETVQAVVEPDLREVVLESGAVGAWLREERRRAFALDRPPLWRVTLVGEGDTHLMVLAAHHLILDGSSLPVVVREFAAHYAGDAATLAALDPQPLQFGAYRARRAAPASADAMARWKAHWDAALGAGAPDWSPPGAARPEPPVAYEAGTHGLVLEGALRAALVRRGAAARATLFHTLLTAYLVLLHRVSGQERVMVGIDVADREPGEAGVVGCCNRLVPVVADFAGTLSVAQALEQVRAQVLRGIANCRYTLTMWEQDRRVAVDPMRPFKITATMNMQRFPVPPHPLATRVDLEAGSVSRSPFGLAFEVRDQDDGVRVDIVHNTRLVDAGTAGRYAGYYRRLLEAMAAGAEGDVRALPMLPDDEVAALLRWGRAPRAAPAYESLPERFAAQAAATPHAPAVACRRHRLTYRELQGRVSGLTRRIGARGIRSGMAVAVLGERGSGYVAAVMAVLAAGGVYVPLDPRAPDARLRGQVAKAGIALILHDADLAGRVAALCGAGGPDSLCLEAEPGPAGAAPHAAPALEAEAPAYALFTSGSTGAPKAALVSHGGLMNHLRAKIDLLGLSATDVVAQTAPQCFDISVWQCLAPLLVGGSVQVVEDSVACDPHALFAAADARAVTVLQVVPTVLAGALEAMSVPARRPSLAALRWLIATGEALPAALCRRWISLFTHVPVVNAYGPTECSDDVAHHVMVWPPAAGVVRAPIGRPIPGAELYVVDAGGYLAAPGAPGELLVGGACVGLGYLGDPERTAAAFVPDRFSGRPQARLYRTGDLVRFHDDGTLDYLGRIDGQLKIDGVRIEPREVETALLNDPSVQQSFVTAGQRPDGGRALVAYVVLRPGKRVLPGTLKAVARNALPQALVPAAFVFLDRLPLTPNGKIDQAALPAPDLRPRIHDATPPATAAEEAVMGAWSHVTGWTGFGVHADFFDLGGRSLDATRIVRRIEDDLGIRIPLAQVFRTPTVAGLAAYLDARAAAAG